MYVTRVNVAKTSLLEMEKNENSPSALAQHGGQLCDEEKGKGRRTGFEDAITACGYGKFHYFLILAMIPACTAQVCSSLSVAYVIPIAECDLKLTNNDKGAINAAVYIGLTVGAFSGGFASDVFGRRRIILIGFLAEFVFNMVAAFAHSFWLLFLMKICSGFSITGPIVSLISYTAETHNNEMRPRIIMMNGALSAMAQAAQPVLAYFLIPMDFRIELIPGVLDFTSWRLFLLLCALPSLIAAIAFYFLPESPKFLMSIRRFDEALESLKRIYALNSGKPAHTYPIYDLEVPAQQSTTAVVIPSKGVLNIISSGWKQVRPIFRPPHLNLALVVFGISACTMIAMNCIRGWVPQFFATLIEAKQLNATGVTTICGLIGSVAQSAPSSSESSQEGYICPPISGEVFIRSFVISATAAFSYLLTTPFIGCIGKRTFAKLTFPTAAAVVISINWATSTDIFMALLAIYVALMRNCFSILSSITADLFPTAFRSVAMSMTMMCGRIATMFGNLLFPVLLNIHCNIVFSSLGGILALASALVWFVSNKTDDS